jgi:hypothetical protein
VRKDGAVQGNFQVQSRQNNPDTYIHGTVLCLTVVGNQAWMVGLVTASDGETSPAGTFTRWRVVDNGEGTNTPPDQISLMEVGILTFPPYCTTLPERPVLRDIEAGNIQIH